MGIGELLWPFLVYWLVLFVTNYIIVEFGQNYLYDETVPGFGLKVALGSFVLSAVLLWTRSSFETMFTTELGYTLLQAILWFGVFTLVYRFQPWHGAGIGIAAMLIIVGLATLAVDSMTSPSRAARPQIERPAQPVRRSTRPVTAPAGSEGAATEADLD